MTTLAQYDRARAALAEATRIDQVLPILDEIDNVRIYARAIEDQALLADATEYQMRAERRLGEVIKAAKKIGHFREGRPHKPKNGSGDTEPFPVATLEEVGVGKKLSARSQKRASIAEQAFEIMVKATRERIAAANANPINGARAVQGSRLQDPASLDFSPTPPFATRALCQHVMPAAGLAGKRFKSVWEPACGEGHMAEVLCEYADNVFASDVHDYGYGEALIDFLSDDPQGVDPVADWIITNPPFKEKAEQFALRALDRAQVGVAIFARLQWLETIGRYERLFRDQPPTLIAFFCERVNLCMGRWEPDGGTATAYVWLVWIKGAKPRAPFWIPPGCRESLTRPDDAERFTAHPVMRRLPPHDPVTGEVIETAENAAA